MARDHEQHPTPIRHPGASQTGRIDVEAIEHLQAEVEARARRYFVALLARLAQWIGVPSLAALGGYGFASSAQPDQPQHREQPASGPEPQPEPRPQPHALECTPAEREQLLEAEQRASRDARAAVDAMHAMRDACRDQRETP